MQCNAVIPNASSSINRPLEVSISFVLIKLKFISYHLIRRELEFADNASRWRIAPRDCYHSIVLHLACIIND